MPTRPQVLLSAVSTLSALCLLCSLGGCTEPSRTEEITKTRSSTETLPLGLDDDKRFGWNDKAKKAPAKSSGPLSWTVPTGWIEKPASQYRLGSFTVPGGVDCSLSLAGGDLKANIDRWRGQLSQAPWSQAEIDQLPKHKMLGQDAYLIEFESDDGRKLAGMILPGAPASTFIKMMGGTSEVNAELANMKALALSITAGGQAAQPAQQSPSSKPSSRPSSAAADGGHSHPAGEDHGEGYKWKVPEGWTKSAPRPMRVANYNPKGNAELNAYFSILGGNGGGMHANVNRWRGQVGLGPVEEDALDSLPTLMVLGKASPVVDVAATDGSEAMIAVTVEMPDSTIYIKLMGPKTDVDATRDQFKTWCKSLEVDR